MRSAWLLVGGVGLILASVNTAGAQKATPQLASLMPHATRLADASTWVSPLYLWQSPHTVLTFRGDNNGDCVFSFALVDTLTGKSRPQSQLNAQWKQYLSTLPGRGPRCILDASLSPDGRWLYLTTKFTTRLRPHEIVLHTGPADGGVLLGLDAQPNPSVNQPKGAEMFWGWSPAWTPDSLFALDVSEAGGLHQYSVTGDPQPRQGPQSVPPSALFSVAQSGDVKTLGITEDARLLVASIGSLGDYVQKINLVSLALNPSQVPPTVRPVSLPQGRWWSHVEISPNGKRLAWVLDRFQRESLDKSEADERENQHEEFWISRVDGTGFRPLGWVNRAQDERRELAQWQFPKAVHWTPDSGHLSFVYKDVLYTVPVN